MGFKLGAEIGNYAVGGEIKTKMRFGQDSGGNTSVPGVPVISKKLGSSVERNLFKRFLRNLYFEGFVKKNLKIALIILPKRIKLNKEEIVESFELLKKSI